MPVPPPYPLAMVICDMVWRDPYTAKCTLIGTFSAICSAEFPAVHPVLSVYISLTDGRGVVPIRLVLVDADEEREPIFQQDQDIEFVDPRAIVELVFVTGGVQFPDPGEYRLKLLAAEEFIMERRILVLAPPAEEQQA